MPLKSLAVCADMSDAANAMVVDTVILKHVRDVMAAGNLKCGRHVQLVRDVAKS